ncbi:MAG: tryptophan 7-halogenase, partial [Nannocystaceae bacterium]
GASTAVFLAQQGVRSVIVEKDAFPRFHIGESMTGYCGGVVRAMGLEEHMQSQGHPVKHGVTVYGTSGKNTFWVPVMSRGASGELEDYSTWQVRRSTFDKEALKAAKKAGSEIVTGQATEVLRNADGSVGGIMVRTPRGETIRIESKVVVDSSGMATFLSNAGVAGTKERGKYDRQLAMFSHLRGAAREPGKARGNTLIFYANKNHWAWLIPIEDDVVSVGVVVPSNHFREQKLDRETFYRRQLKQLNPELALRVKDVELVEPVRAASNYSYQVRNFTGKGFLCVGDAHRFVDPIFSFGLHFAVTEGQLAAEAIGDYLRRDGQGFGNNPFALYEEVCERGMDAIEDMVDCFWLNPLAFSFFVHQKFRDDLIDLFAGRVYEQPPNPGLVAIRAAKASALAKLQEQAAH